MNFKQQSAKTEKRLVQGKQQRFATCHPSFMRRDNGMLNVRLQCPGYKLAQRSLGFKVKPDQFNHDTREVIGEPEKTARVQDLEASIQKVFTERVITDRSTDPNVILDIAFGLRSHDDIIPSIREAIERFLQHKEKALGNDLVRSSFRQYQRYRNILGDFTTIHYGKDAKLDVLKPAVYYELLGYVKGERGNSHNYAGKVLQFFKAVLTYAVAYEWCDRNVLQAVRFVKKKKEVITLEMADLVKLAQVELAEDYLTEVRDVFLLCCMTGLAYVDVKTLSPEHIVMVDEVQCILKNRQKSAQKSIIPLFPEAIALLNKYQDHRICRINGVCMPVLSNVKMNKWLKVIGNVAKIKEPLHTHLARKTFTMYAEERGFKLEQTSIIMGHAYSSMTSTHYYRQRQKTVISAFKNITRSNSQDDNRQAG